MAHIMMSAVCAGYMAIIVLALRNKLPQPAETAAPWVAYL